MNQEERDWLEWLKRAQDGIVTQRQAAAKMGVSDRWVRKLLVRMKTDGDGVVVHGLRGRSSNRRIDEQTQARVVELLKRPEWHDFGPTFASQQLAKGHGLDVSKETVRGWVIAAGLWKAQPRKLGEAHFWRPRRSGYGELVQWDTSNHDWLDGRGEAVRYLVKWIDDATSRSGGSFVRHDGTRENMGVLWQYVEGNGRMVDLYNRLLSNDKVSARIKGRLDSYCPQAFDSKRHHMNVGVVRRAQTLTFCSILCSFPLKRRSFPPHSLITRPMISPIFSANGRSTYVWEDYRLKIEEVTLVGQVKRGSIP
jgi:hypothetical protein